MTLAAVVDLPLHLRRLADLGLARADPVIAILITMLGDRRSACCSQRALRALPRHGADLGRRGADAVLRVADPLRRDARARGATSAWYMLNPLAAALTQMRHAVIDPSAPTAAAAIGGWARLLIPLAIVLGLFALGVVGLLARGAAGGGEPVTELTTDERAELEALRARVAELERERAEQIARANAAVAAAQERAYWLDRWHVDLNALMERPGAAEFRAARARRARGRSGERSCSSARLLG